MKKYFTNNKKTMLFKILFIILITFFISPQAQIDILDEPIAYNNASFTSVSNVFNEIDSNNSDSNFEIHFLDVGQADSTLIICDNKSMLVDGGNVEDSSFLYSYLKKNEIKHLDYVIATHSHEDHVGGLPGALNFATFDNVYSPTLSYDSKAFNNFSKYVQLQGKEIVIPKDNDNFNLGSALVTILACNSYEEINNTSIVLKIVYKNTSFLLMADAEREVEELLLTKDLDLSSTLLKIGHHGSDTSTTYPFLREVMPSYGIISVGENNPYYHPHKSTLSKLNNANIKVFRTDMQGTIICKSDGNNLTFVTEK